MWTWCEPADDIAFDVWNCLGASIIFRNSCVELPFSMSGFSSNHDSDCSCCHAYYINQHGQNAKPACTETLPTFAMFSFMRASEKHNMMVNCYSHQCWLFHKLYVRGALSRNAMQQYWRGQSKGTSADTGHQKNTFWHTSNPPTTEYSPVSTKNHHHHHLISITSTTTTTIMIMIITFYYYNHHQYHQYHRIT